MPIVMDLGFGEDGDAGDRGTVSKQAIRDTRFTQVQAPGGKTLLLLVCSLITAEPKVTGVRRFNLARRHVCGSMSREI